MSGEVKRGDTEERIREAFARIRALEEDATIGTIINQFQQGCCNPVIVNPGDIEIDPQYVDCIDLQVGSDGALGVAVPPGQQTYMPFSIPVGNYQCNYDAGFRLQMTLFYHGVDIITPHIYYSTSATPGQGTGDTILIDAPSPGGGGFTGYFGSGWVTFESSPAAGQLVPYYATCSFSTGNGLSDGTIILAALAIRWILSGTAEQVLPWPTVVGQMIVTLDGATWTILGPGTAGQVLTMSGGVPTWV